MDFKQASGANCAGAILFVDDEPLSLKYFKASVGKYAKVVTASTTEAAMEILQAQGNTISVVVSDERMPHDSGVSFLSDVRKSWPSTVRILTSAYANIDLEQAINGAGIHRFVAKPWDLDELCSAVKEALHAEHAEHATIASAAPAMHEQRTDAQTASLELVAVLARELAQPLQFIEAEAVKIATMSGMQASPPISRDASAAASWLAQYRDATQAASADRIRRQVEHCKALTGPIAALTDSLIKTASVKSYSMAETVAEALAKIHRSSRHFIELDARNDFTYRIPKEVMGFVLDNLLQATASSAGQNASSISITLVRSFDYNEVTISAQGASIKDKAELERINRSALWAFGGELLFSSDYPKDHKTASIRLPITARSGTSASH